jgi:hypothetical protein
VTSDSHRLFLAHENVTTHDPTAARQVRALCGLNDSWLKDNRNSGNKSRRDRVSISFGNATPDPPQIQRRTGAGLSRSASFFQNFCTGATGALARERVVSSGPRRGHVDDLSYRLFLSGNARVLAFWARAELWRCSVAHRGGSRRDPLFFAVHPKPVLRTPCGCRSMTGVLEEGEWEGKTTSCSAAAVSPLGDDASGRRASSFPSYWCRSRPRLSHRGARREGYAQWKRRKPDDKRRTRSLAPRSIQSSVFRQPSLNQGLSRSFALAIASLHSRGLP